MMEGLFDTWERRFDRTEAWPVVFLVLTDGPETSSNINEDQVNALVVDLMMNGATVHAVLLQNQLGGQAGGFQTQAAPFLAETTGGLVRMVNTAPLMSEAVAEFGTLIGDHFDEMATRYRITYERPSDTPGAQVPRWGSSAASRYGRSQIESCWIAPRCPGSWRVKRSSASRRA